MSQVHKNVDSGDYRQRHDRFLWDINIQWNWPVLSCPHWGSHLPKTPQAVNRLIGSLSCDAWLDTMLPKLTHWSLEDLKENLDKLLDKIFSCSF